MKNPNPAFSDMNIPLIRSLKLCTKKGRQIWLEPSFNNGQYEFSIRSGKFTLSKDGTIEDNGAKCLFTETSVPFKYIREEAKAGRLGTQLLAIIAQGERERVYLSSSSSEQTFNISIPDDFQNVPLPKKALGFRIQQYGMSTFRDLFTSRQLLALYTLTDLLSTVRSKVVSDSKKNGMIDDEIGIEKGGCASTAYAEAVSVYLAFAINRLADYNSTITTWKPSGEQVMQTFKRQALPMTWDFPESNIFIERSICWLNAVKYEVDNLNKTTEIKNPIGGFSIQADASKQNISQDMIISTDPPYYDNIGYADLSDFFYIWLRRSLRDIYPSLFSTITVPKAEELIASPFRHSSKEESEAFFLQGMEKAIHNLYKYCSNHFPVTIYYAFKQSETKDATTTSSGWKTFLEAVIRAGFKVCGTWPVRTELSNRIRDLGSNALASSIVLVCKKRPNDAPQISRRDFQRELRETIPEALETMIGGKSGQSPVAPVDLAQAAIGPGMAVFSKYSAVLNQDGSQMSVHDALVLINREITDFLNPDSGSFDADTLFCSAWFDQYGWTKAAFGEADVLARAKGTTVDTVQHAGVIEAC